MIVRPRPGPLVPVTLALSLLLATAVSMLSGPVRLTPGAVITALGGGGDATSAAIVLGVRLPRTLTAILAGGALAVAGAVFQALLRNPLADPYLLGVSSGAALGAVLCLSLGAAAGSGSVTAAALAGGALAAFLVYRLARSEGGLPPTTLILAGVVISSFASALVLVLNVMMESRQLQGALFWIMGSLASADLRWLGPVGLAVGAGLAIVQLRAGRLNLLTQGEETACALGVDAEAEKRLLFLACCLLTGGVVAVSGLIGFVGLVVPHAVRAFTGPDHRLLVPSSFLAGASFLVLADVAARTVLAPAELPVGVVTALAGAPFFLFLLRRRARVWG